jgi:hypothetical protein
VGRGEPAGGDGGGAADRRPGWGGWRNGMKGKWKMSEVVGLERI